MTTPRQMLDHSAAVTKLDRNLRVAMRFFGEASGTGDLQTLDGAEVVFSGLDYGVFNIAFLTSPVASPQALADAIHQCGEYYRGRRVRWSFWLCEDLLDTATRRRCRELFAAKGMRQISQAPGMVASTLAPPARVLPEIVCRPVTTPAARFAFAELTSICFDIPFSIARAIYEPEGAWKRAYRGFVGYVSGRPVGMVALVGAEGALGIYSLGTLPDQRRRGYGEALLRTVLREHRDGEPMVLESTEAGYPLYRRLGFRDAARFSVYLVK